MAEEEILVSEQNNEEITGEKAWYCVCCYSTHERKTADNLQKRAETMEDGKFISRIIVAEVEVQVMKDGLPTGQTKIKNLYPSYFFVEMVMTDKAWYLVRNTPGVTGFVGSSGKGTKPFPIPREQMEPILKRMGMVDEAMYNRYNVGDTIRIIRGTFEGTEGTILSINRETGLVEVETYFFGNSTRVEIEFAEIEKLG